MASANGTDQSAVAVAAGLGQLEGLLGAILSELRSEVLNVGVSDAHGQGLTLAKWPVSGSKRVLAYRTGNGFDALAVPTTGVSVFTPNEGRIGLTLINTGANALILYLSDQQRKGVPCVFLAASGGSWDGRFGNVLWAGNVFAVAQTGATTLVGGEI